jgi:hypothetical protein
MISTVINASPTSSSFPSFPSTRIHRPRAQPRFAAPAWPASSPESDPSPTSTPKFHAGTPPRLLALHRDLFSLLDLNFVTRSADAVRMAGLISGEGPCP